MKSQEEQLMAQQLLAAERKAKTMEEKRKTLPVYQYRQQFLDAVKEYQVLIVVGETGSGKTTAFLIPTVELVCRLKFKPRNGKHIEQDAFFDTNCSFILGTGVIIMSPTRELAIQIFETLQELMANHSQTYGLFIGGVGSSARKNEAIKLNKGVNIIVCTPGRLWDHLEVCKRLLLPLLYALLIEPVSSTQKGSFSVI